MLSKTDCLTFTRVLPDRRFIPTFIPCLIDSAAAPIAHAEMSISVRVFFEPKSQRNHANRSAFEFSVDAPQQAFVGFSVPNSVIINRSNDDKRSFKKRTSPKLIDRVIDVR